MKAISRTGHTRMEEFYTQIRTIHIAAVVLSGSLFLVRAVGHNLIGARWPMSLALRSIAWTVDTILLTAALMLMTIIEQYPLADAWLTVKVVLLVAYIVIGWWAFRAGRRKMRVIFSMAALAAFGFIYTVARAHDPLGFLATI